MIASLFSVAPAHARGGRGAFEYLDLLSAEVVGELGSRTYDAHQGDNFVGNAHLDKGYALLGGFGMRTIFRTRHGIRVGAEWSAAWGRLKDVGGPFSAYSTVTHGEVLTSLGYEFTVGRVLVLHSCTLLGVGITKLDAIPAITQALSDMAPPPTPASLALSDTSLRFGQQVGFHVQLGSAVALYGDGTIDYDGQWRVRAGIAFGLPAR